VSATYVCVCMCCSLLVFVLFHVYMLTEEEEKCEQNVRKSYLPCTDLHREFNLHEKGIPFRHN